MKLDEAIPKREKGEGKVGFHSMLMPLHGENFRQIPQGVLGESVLLRINLAKGSETKLSSPPVPWECPFVLFLTAKVGLAFLRISP